MALPVRLVVDGIGDVSFLVGKTNTGRVPTGRHTILEELTADGIDDFRWRRRRYSYIKFQMRSTADGPDWLSGKDEAQTYEDMSGEYGTLTVTAGGITETWRKVKVLDCQTNLMPGTVVGLNADANSSYVLDAIWTMVITGPAS